MENRISKQEALIYVMVIMSAADQSMTDRELMTLGEVVKTLPVFRGFSEDQLVAIAEQCAERLRSDDGLDQLLDIVLANLPESLRETAYALAVEIAAADLDVQLEELRLLQILRDRLDIAKLSVAAIEYGARIRYRA